MVAVYFLISLAMTITVVIVAGIGGFAWSIWQRTKPSDLMMREQYVQAMARSAICPACLYDLLGSAADDEGIATCSECGSHWRADRFERTEPVQIPDESTSSVFGLRTKSYFGQSHRKTYQDTRGQWYTLAEPRSRMVRKRLAGAAHEERVKRANRRSRKKGRFSRWFLGVLFLMMLIPGLVWAPMTGAGLGFMQFLRVLIRWAVFLAFMVFAWQFARGRMGVKPERIIEDALDEDLCPACWTDLAAAPIDEEAKTIDCHTCGARWSVGVQSEKRERQAELPDLP